MNVRIYQIDESLCEEAAKALFNSWENLTRIVGALKPEWYKLVYSGDIECHDLEDLYRILNSEERPFAYEGRSLSVSDIVEIREGGQTVSYNFCDSIGYKTLDQFDTDKILEKIKMIKAVVVRPGEKPTLEMIPAGLTSLQQAVDGYIESCYCWEDEAALICDRDGKLNGKKLCRAIRSEEAKEVSYKELKEMFSDKERDGSGEHMTGCITFTADSYNKEYSEEARTYRVSSDNKAFKPNMSGYSIFGSSIDGSDRGVRLDSVMAAEKGGANGWKIEKCTVIAETDEITDIVAGTFLIVGTGYDTFESLSDSLAEKFRKKFEAIEEFAIHGDNHISVIRLPDK